jgi:iron-sulfur cluster repair protein YtfE (RIC family)
MNVAKPTQPLRDEHKELFPHIESLRAAADSVGEAPVETVRRKVAESHEFLVHHLLPHARAEERALYPVVARLMGAPEAKALRAVLYGLSALVSVHFAKEEEVYLPILDQRLTDAEARHLFEAMEEAAKEAKASSR